MYVIDTECYSNFWLLCAQHKDTGERKAYVLPDCDTRFSDEDCQEIKTLLATQHTVSFNGLSYDLPMIAAAVVDGYDTTQLKDLSDK